jgi:hypothetical protein
MGTKARKASTALFLAGALLASGAGCSGGGGATGAAGSSGTAGSGGPGTGGSTGTAGNGACAALPSITRRVWRLSVEQYGNAVRDLLGLSAPVALSNRGGEADYAFFSDVTLQVDANFQFALYQASQDVISNLTPAQITALAPCSGTTTTAQAACAMTFAQTLGSKAFRRQLDASEVTNMMTVFNGQGQASGAAPDYNTGIGMMIQAMIISPSFIYRTELGPPTLTADANGNFPDTTLTPDELASQLGFLFLGSLPDSGLLAAAADGSIATPDGLAAQIDRLLALPAVKANLTGIVIDWFNVRQMFSKTKDTSLLSALTPADQDQTGIESDLYTSTQQFVNDVLWNGSGKIDDLMTSQEIVVNKRLATLFPGLTFSGATSPTSNTTFVAAAWPAAQGRSGILTQPSFLWSASDPSLNSVVKRGKMIHDDVICQDPLPPPIDLTTPMAMNVIACKSPDGTTSLSTCDSEILKSDARMMYQPCKACHSQMDPYARVLHNFGPIGNYRTTDEAGRPIDPTATFVPTSPLAPQTVTGAAAFAQDVVASGVFDGCSVQKMASYAIGTMIRTYNTCEINDLRTQTDGTVASLFRQVALANFVRARAGGTQ